MNRPISRLADYPLQMRALTAFRKAVERVIAEHRREGLPAYILSDGKVVDALKPRSVNRRVARPASQRRSAR